MNSAATASLIWPVARCLSGLSLHGTDLSMLQGLLEYIEPWIALAVLVGGLLIPPVRMRGGIWCTFLVRRRKAAVLFVAALAFLVCAAQAMLQGIAVPATHDEFSYLLQGDTFAHGRLSNPTHALHAFFETFHELQQPTYASRYPPAQAAFLAIGQVTTGIPLVGVWLGYALACGALCWMLQAWLPPRWALLGALLYVARFIVFPGDAAWSQSYWGGGVAMLGGALLFGAARRLFDRPRVAAGCVLATGLVILAGSRPLEGFAVSLPVLIALGWRYAIARPFAMREAALRAVLPGLLVALPGLALLGYCNFAITGSWKTFPTLHYLQTYNGAPAFWWQSALAVPEYTHAAMREFHTRWEYDQWAVMQSAAGWFSTAAHRVLAACHFFLGYLLLVPMLLALSLRKWTRAALCTLLWVGVVSLQVSWFHPHYIAPAAPLVVFLVTSGLRRMWYLRLGNALRLRAAVQLTLAVYALWLLLVLVAGSGQPRSGWPYTRAAVERDLEQRGGQHLVIVHYDQGHDIHREWVYNRADIDAAPVIWAREIPQREHELLAYFSGRQVWRLHADRSPPRYEPVTAAAGR
jgi:hypothetical protein